MKTLILLVAVLVTSAEAQQTSAQNTPLLPTAEANQLATRISQLMESTATVVPGLSNASNILIGNAKQTVSAMQVTPGNAALTYDLWSEANNYVALLDAMPKPFPLAEAAKRQFVELRDAVERLDVHLRALLDQKEHQLRNPDRDNLRRYSDANDRLNPPTQNFTRVVFFGDSITDFWRLNEYFTGKDFVNRGISGQVTGEMLGRMKADVIDIHPKAMLILAGTNDIARGVPLRTIENNLSMIADLCKANNIIPLFASVLPVSDYHKAENPRYEMTKTHPANSINELNQWIKEYCRTHNYVYVDYWSALKDASGMLPADLADDGLHPNAKGYRLMAPVATQALDEALAERSPQQQPPAKKKRSGLFGTGSQAAPEHP